MKSDQRDEVAKITAVRATAARMTSKGCQLVLSCLAGMEDLHMSDVRLINAPKVARMS